MTPNNTMALEEAKKILKQWEIAEVDNRGHKRIFELDGTGFFLGKHKTVFFTRLIHAARVVQRAEDAEILAGYFDSTAYIAGCDSCGEPMQEAYNKILTPEAPLSDNQTSK